jgi:hypothetical protein
MTRQTQDYDTILARYADGPAQLEAALAGLGEADLDVALTDDAWTIRQIVHHIVDGDDLWKAAIKAALGNSRMLFSYLWYWDIPQDTWAGSWNYAGRAIEPSLALFRANRRHVVQLLQTIPAAWDRYTLITLPGGEEKPATISYVVEMQTRHVTHHVADIRQIRRAHNL